MRHISRIDDNQRKGLLCQENKFAPGKNGPARVAGNAKNPPSTAPTDNTEPVETSGPQFAEPGPTPDPTKFIIKHGSDKEAYTILDSEKGSILPREFPQGPAVEPILTLAQAIGPQGTEVSKAITRAGQNPLPCPGRHRKHPKRKRPELGDRQARG